MKPRNVFGARMNSSCLLWKNISWSCLLKIWWFCLILTPRNCITSVFRKTTHTDWIFSSPLDAQGLCTLYTRAWELWYRKRHMFILALQKIKNVTSRISRQPSIASSSLPDQEPVVFKAYLNPLAGFWRRSILRSAFAHIPHLSQLLVKPKDVTPIEARSSVVYKVPCKDCERTYAQSGDLLKIWKSLREYIPFLPVLR